MDTVQVVCSLITALLEMNWEQLGTPIGTVQKRKYYWDLMQVAGIMGTVEAMFLQFPTLLIMSMVILLPGSLFFLHCSHPSTWERLVSLEILRDRRCDKCFSFYCRSLSLRGAEE